MRTFILLIGLIVGINWQAKTVQAAPAAVDTQAEIVIEMTGSSTTKNEWPIFDLSAPQLVKRLRGKTREEVLYQVPLVSYQDRYITGTQAAYYLVAYRQENAFRFFLFQADEPQTLLTAAATAADALAVNEKYGVTLPLPQAAFEAAYRGRFSTEMPDGLSIGSRVYQMPYAQTGSKTETQHWFVFEKKVLTHQFNTQTAWDSYRRQIQPPAPAAPSTPTVPSQPKPKKRKVYTAIVSGGTLWDRMYMPRVIKSGNSSSEEKKQQDDK